MGWDFSREAKKYAVKHNIGSTLTVKTGSFSNVEYTGQVSAIEFSSIQDDCVKYASSKQDAIQLNKEFSQYSDTVIRYGIYVNGMLNYFFKHQIID